MRNKREKESDGFSFLSFFYSIGKKTNQWYNMNMNEF